MTSRVESLRHTGEIRGRDVIQVRNDVGSYAIHDVTHIRRSHYVRYDVVGCSVTSRIGSSLRHTGEIRGRDVIQVRNDVNIYAIHDVTHIRRSHYVRYDVIIMSYR